MDSTAGNHPNFSTPVRVIDSYKNFHNSVLGKEKQKNVLEVARHLPRHSLQEMSILKVVTSLCNNRQLLGLILRCKLQKKVTLRTCPRNSRGWKDILAVANELVSSTCNSVLLRKKILEYLWPVCYKIMLWKSVYAPDIEDVFLQYFYWNDRGKIDTTRTAKRVIANKNVPVRQRFILGCKICLEEELKEIWPEMPNEDKKFFLTLTMELTSPLFLFWARTLEGLHEDFLPYANEALVSSVKLGLLLAVKCIYSMLNKNRRRKYVVAYMDHLLLKFRESLYLEEDEKDIVYFLFFEIREEEQEKGFKTFMPLMWSLLLYSKEYEVCLSLFEDKIFSDSTGDFLLYLEIIFLKYNFEASNDDACGWHFMDVWRMIPPSRRNSLTKSALAVKLAPQLIRDHFPLLLEKDVSSKLIRSSLEKNVFDQGKWEFLQFLVKEEILATNSFFENSKYVILDVLGKKLNEAAWKKFVKSIRYIQRISSKHKKI